ncbi:acylphosphatase [Candidatus Kaiserbacteria bacterium]|nr:acylphosphatase [Candidatus Kaiserbacteria bacterium]
MQEIHCIVKGRVQMVMYRDFVQRKARGLRLAGIVRNLDNGTVEVVAQGNKEDLERLVEKLRKGPLLARVDDVRVEWQEPTQSFDGFKIIF